MERNGGSLGGRAFLGAREGREEAGGRLMAGQMLSGSSFELVVALIGERLKY